MNQTILNNLEPVVKEGAISRVQLLKQQQEVRTHQADVERLMEEQARLRFVIAQSKEKLQNTIKVKTVFVSTFTPQVRKYKQKFSGNALRKVACLDKSSLS